MDDIDTIGRYLEGFHGDLEKAVHHAIEVRKLEIELYWRRSTYFWTLSAAAFGGFFALQATEPPDKASLLTVCCLGFMFSFAWLLSNRGGKYWQENWEVQVDLLENFNIGPLFKTNLKVDKSALNLNMGDMLVKSGDWQTAQKIYANAWSLRTYATWRYQSVLEDRINRAQANVALLNAEDGTPKVRMMINSAFSCMACHQQ